MSSNFSTHIVYIGDLYHLLPFAKAKWQQVITEVPHGDNI